MSVLCPFCDHENMEGDDVCARCFVALTDMNSLKKQSDIEIDLLHRPLREVMTREFVAVGPHATVGEVVRQLLGGGHHCAIITGSQGEILGVFTERDVLLRLATHFDQRASAPIAEYMTARPETLSSADPLAFALNRMMVGGYRHIPIEDEGKLAGLVSVRHVLGYLVRRFPDAIPANATLRGRH